MCQGRRRHAVNQARIGRHQPARTRVEWLVRAGREFLAIPGPTTIPDDVLQAMHRPAIDIYSRVARDHREPACRPARLFRTKGRSYIYIANGHGAWEAALTNVLSRGDRILVLESGRFARGWGDQAARLGVEVEVLTGDWRRAVRPAAVAARLRKDRAGAIKAILAVQIDTASGVVNDIAAIGDAIRAARHDARVHGRCGRLARLRAVRDGRLGRRRRHVGIAEGPDDAAGPLLRRRRPARPREAHRRAGLRTPYWDWTAREGKLHYLKYAGTAPEHLLFGLRRRNRHDPRRRARQRLSAPPPARRGGAPRRRRVVACAAPWSST